MTHTLFLPLAPTPHARTTPTVPIFPLVPSGGLILKQGTSARSYVFWILLNFEAATMSIPLL